MFWSIAYLAVIVYAALLFCYTASRRRDPAALGILMSTSGVQLAIMDTIYAPVAMLIAIAGLALVGADLVADVTKVHATTVPLRTAKVDAVSLYEPS